jgi:hypothetical protein
MQPFETFTTEDRELAARVLDRAEQNGVKNAGDQSALIALIFGVDPFGCKPPQG